MPAVKQTRKAFPTSFIPAALPGAGPKCNSLPVIFDNSGSILTVPLTSDLTSTASDARADVLVLPSIVLVKLVLIVDDPRDADYTAVVTTAKDAEVFKTGSLKPHPNDAGRGVDLYVPANRLPDGDYVIHLSGVLANNETIAVGNYYLRVRKS